MKNPNYALLFFQILFSAGFFAVLLIGAYLAKNFETLFGVDATVPNENSSERAYTKLQVFAVWVHALLLTGMLALLLH